jgi:hypothetical protein
MLLKQIEERQRKMIEEKQKKLGPARLRSGDAKPTPARPTPAVPTADDEAGTKTVGIPVPPDLYAGLATVKLRRGLPSLRAAALLALRRGVGALLTEDR